MFGEALHDFDVESFVAVDDKPRVRNAEVAEDAAFADFRKILCARRKRDRCEKAGERYTEKSNRPHRHEDPWFHFQTPERTAHQQGTTPTNANILTGYLGVATTGIFLAE
jgi:hypothetical protein